MNMLDTANLGVKGTVCFLDHHVALFVQRIKVLSAINA